MKLFRFLAYSFALFLGTCFAFRGTNSYPAPPPKQYEPRAYVKPVSKVATGSSTDANGPSVQLGKTLFTANCASCHNRNMKDDLTGPALGEATKNWAAYPKEDLYQWIRNSQVMIDAKHPRALELWKKWAPVIMTSFPNLSDEDIEAMLAYMDAIYSY